MINPYLYIRQKYSDNFHLKKETSLWTVYSVDFPSARPLQYLDNSQVRGEYYLPKRVTSLPLAILVHGMGDRSVVPCRLIAHTLAKQGIASFILYLVFHKSRISETIKNKYPRLSAEEWFEAYQLSVTDISQVIDWSTSRPEIIKDKIAIAGISFGGLVSSIGMALDTRIKAGIFIVSGGNSDKVTRHSFLLRRLYKINEEEYLRGQKAYAQYLAQVESQGFENVTADKRGYLTDPLTFSRYLRDRPVLMLNALWDEIIPKVATLDLWEAFGKPPINWYPATHASIWLWYPFMGPRIYGFLKSALFPLSC